MLKEKLDKVGDNKKTGLIVICKKEDGWVFADIMKAYGYEKPVNGENLKEGFFENGYFAYVFYRNTKWGKLDGQFIPYSYIDECFRNMALINFTEIVRVKKLKKLIENVTNR